MASDRRAREQEREARKARRQKIFIAIGGVLLLVLVGVQLPSLLGSSSGAPSSSPASPTSPREAATAAVATSAGHGAGGSLLPKTIARLTSRDIFMPQVSGGGEGVSAASSAGTTPRAPAVRGKDFVAKDVFVPQITPPAASSTTSSVLTSGQGSGQATGPAVVGGAGYIVVLATIPGTGQSSQKAAAQALVAAKNAGLKDVVANNAVPGNSSSAPHFTVYTGPYQYIATAQTELVRALRNGYPNARTQQLPSSSGKGF